MSDVETRTNVAPASANAGIPPIGIKHLLLFTTLAAVFFAIERASDYYNQLPPDTQDTLIAASRTNSLFYYMVTAAAATGVITLLIHRDSNGRAFRASGHWVILAHVVVATLWLPNTFLAQSPSAIGWYITICVVSAIVFAVIARANVGRWRWMFIARSVISAISALSFCLFIGISVQQIGGLAITLSMLACLVQETLSGKHRDWPHCLGIVTMGGMGVISIFWQIATYAGWFT